MFDDRVNRIWEFVVERDIATDEEIQLVVSINGYNEETLNNILYARTGYHDIEQIIEKEEEEEC